MPSRNANAVSRRRHYGGHRKWLRRSAAILLALLVIVAVLFTVRFALLQFVATHVINNDADIVAQEHKDGVAVEFGNRPTAWVAPMKNLMNPIWKPIEFSGVNYFTFAGPSSAFGYFSERSNPASRYYQAWFGAYVAKPDGGVIPTDLSALANQIASLDQRSWLEAMGDPHPLAEGGDGGQEGLVTIDGHEVPLWHFSMRSHSDLSPPQPQNPLAVLIGAPREADWRADVDPFHDVSIDGYFAGWNQTPGDVVVIVYTAAVAYDTRSQGRRDNSSSLKDELLGMMRGVHVVPVTAN